MRTINYEGKSITFVSTAHVSKQSIIEVKETIEALNPDAVCIELDAARAKNLTSPNRKTNLDIKEIIKNKKFGVFLSNLILSSYQKQIASDLDTQVGGEMLQAIESAKEISAPLYYIDRNVQTTFKRLWNSLGLWKKAQLAATLLGSLFVSDDTIDAEEIENLKSSDLLYKAVEELDEKYPEISSVILYERNQYMAEKIKAINKENIVVVLGAAHTEGVIECLNQTHSIQELDQIPEKKGNRWVQWLIPGILITALILSTLQNPNVGLQQLVFWISLSTVLATGGAIVAGAHPFTVIVTIVTTWLGILSPVLAVGMFAGFTEAYFRPPYEEDFSSISDNARTLKGWYQNRILRIAMIFFLTSLLSSLGTFISGANIIQSLFR